MPGFAWLSAPEEERIPRCTFTDPEVAAVGLTLEQAKARHADAQETRMPLSHFDRAICDGATQGFVSIIHRGVAGRVLGAVAVGEGAGELVSELVLATTAKLQMKDLAKAIHPYPALAYGLHMMGGMQVSAQLRDFVRGSTFSCLRSICGGPMLHGA